MEEPEFEVGKDILLKLGQIPLVSMGLGVSLQTLKSEDIVERVRKSLEDRREVRNTAVWTNIRPNRAIFGREQHKGSVTNSD